MPSMRHEPCAGAGRRSWRRPTRTPWDSLNVRAEGPDGLQLTAFQELGGELSQPRGVARRNSR